MILAFSRPSCSLITRLFSVASDECAIRPKTSSLHHRKWPEQSMLHVTKVTLELRFLRGYRLRGRCARGPPSDSSPPFSKLMGSSGTDPNQKGRGLLLEARQQSNTNQFSNYGQVGQDRHIYE